MEVCTEPPVPVEQFELWCTRISTYLLAKLQHATLGGFIPNQILNNTLKPALSNKLTILAIKSLQNLLQHILSQKLNQGHQIRFPLVYNGQFLFKSQCFDIEAFLLIHRFILWCLQILSVSYCSGIIIDVQKGCTYCSLDCFPPFHSFVTCLIFLSFFGILSWHVINVFYELLSILIRAWT